MVKHRGELYRYQKTVAVSCVQQGENVLDLGCGNHQQLRPFLPSEIHYIGVDLDGGDIRHNLEEGLPNKVKDMKFDIIFLDEIMEHIENFRTLLLECKDVLSNKGRIVMSTPSNNRILFGDFFNGVGEEPHHIHCFRKTNVRNLARICGLKITEIKGTYIRILPIIRPWIAINTNQTFYTESIIYRMEINEKDK